MKGKYLVEKLAVVLTALVAVIACSCSALNSGYRNAVREIKKETIAEPDVTELLKQAKALRAQAFDREGLLALIQAYEDIVEIAPTNYEALVNASNYLALFEGTVDYERGKKCDRKKENYGRAIEYSIRAMATNPEFKQRLERGLPIGQAFRGLTEKEFGALVAYFDAIWYRDLEYPGPAVISDIKDLDDISNFMVEMELLNPRNVGFAYYSRGLYLWSMDHVIPGRGYLEQAEDIIQEGIATGEDLWYGYLMMSAVAESRGDKEAMERYKKLMLEQKLPEDDEWYPWMAPSYLREQTEQEKAAAGQGI